MIGTTFWYSGALTIKLEYRLWFFDDGGVGRGIKELVLLVGSVGGLGSDLV
jgi:hypothetical protein